jgi:hypothetical protein
MRLEFNQGVPEGCVEWLNENVGRGNISGNAVSTDQAWFYERVFIPKPNSPQNEGRHVPTITVKDPKLATWFALRWS